MCKSCTEAARSSYKFVKKCKENSVNLINAVDSLNDCFDNTVVDIRNFQSVYISINAEELTIDQFYDTVRQMYPQQTALARFHVIANRKSEKSGKSAKRPRNPKDYSTIFIKTHELMHDPSKKNEFKCKMCQKQYPTSGSLRQHFFNSHFKKEYQCMECPKSFGTAGILQSHITQSHQVIQCGECGKTLLNRSSTLKRHQKVHHRPGKVCYRCGRTYKRSVEFEKHMAHDTCLPPSRVAGTFICDYCGYHCNFKHQILAHIKYEHTNAEGFVCSWCHKKCYSQSALKTHVLKHTGEKNFICTECGGKFVTRQSLINHMRLHTGERPYQCGLCDEAFLSASRRKEHIVRHHVGASFDCDLCEAKYNARRSLLKHRKRHFVSNDEQIIPN